MSHELHETLRHLHEEIERADDVDADDRELLRVVMTDIRDLLDRSTLPAPDAPAPAKTAHREEHHNLAERLKDATWHLEESHPSLANAVGRFLEILGRTIP